MKEVLNESCIYSGIKPSEDYIARNGLVLGFVKIGHFGTRIKSGRIIEVLRNNEEFDEIYTIIPVSTNKEGVCLEGENNIYLVSHADFKKINESWSSPMSVFDDEFYSPNRDWSDDEMDRYL